jgi:hypothetical protein
MASSAQSTTPAVILKNVRTGNWILFFLSVANGLFLYFFPWLAEQYYAWSIKPPMNQSQNSLPENP